MNPKYRFLFIIVSLFLIWHLLNECVLNAAPLLRYTLFVNHVVLKALIYPTKWILEIIGYETMMDYNILKIAGYRGIRMLNPCLGIELFAIFMILPLAYPAKWKTKILFIMAGIGIIHLLNILRMVGLSLVLIMFNNTLPFEYHDNFNMLIYALTFGMWVLFIKIVERNKLLTTQTTA